MVFGTTAVNSIAFALGVLQAASTEQTAGKVAGIAIAVNTFSCLLHSMSRKWGILLNNFLGLVKLAMLVVMIILGFIWLGKDNSIAAANFDSRTAFDTTKSPTGVYRYAEAAVFVIFPFGGFHQANYVR
jgi:amino acid transporter